MATLSAPGLAAPPLGAAANAALAGIAKSVAKTDRADRTKSAAQDFEAVFLNTLFQQMFNNIGKGPFGGGSAAGVWRSLLTDEYAKSFAKAGGIGIADHVQRALLAQQEVR
jgi:Rod binding domain-containing protein